jgi:diaminohydroxyphosphoribosylaminopyrimidine deaminase/5-amino-6-(5-phosphoribosylamino)uracil reductase
MTDPEADHHWMDRALALAARGLYTTAPNPRVGCVLVRDGEVVGEGWHARAGEPHAEVHALRAAGERARGATAYVTLEPCAHHGRTPPCADALIAAGVARVVVAVRDPFPRVDGAGIARLEAAGIAVEVGVGERAATELNCGFLARHARGRPWVRLKIAMSLDGRTALADGTSQWITGPAARADNMRWRARSSAILTGIGTVLADDPKLTVRLDDVETAFVPPLRVVLDSRLRTPPAARVLEGAAPTLLVCAPEALAGHSAIEPARVLTCPRHATGIGLGVVLAELAARDINEVHVEAGPTLAGAFLHAGLVDELLLYINPSLLGDDARPLAQLPPPATLAARLRYELVEHVQVGDDLRLRLRPPANRNATAPPPR